MTDIITRRSNGEHFSSILARITRQKRERHSSLFMQASELEPFELSTAHFTYHKKNAVCKFCIITISSSTLRFFSPSFYHFSPLMSCMASHKIFSARKEIIFIPEQNIFFIPHRQHHLCHRHTPNDSGAHIYELSV